MRERGHLIGAKDKADPRVVSGLHVDLDLVIIRELEVDVDIFRDAAAVDGVCATTACEGLVRR